MENTPLTNPSTLFQTVLRQQDWDQLFQRGRPLSFAKGDTLIARGTHGDSLFYIKQGRVEVSLVLADGSKAILNQMGPGETLGELSVLDGGVRSADAVAASDTVDVVAISRSHVFETLKIENSVLTGLIAELCARVRNASNMFEVKSEKSARIRLARTLLHLASKWGERNADGIVLIPGFSQTELGDFAGIARESVNRQLRHLEEDALILRDDVGIRLLDVDGIAETAQL